MPCLVGAAGEEISLGHPLVDEYLELVRARARRNTLLATSYELKVFFEHVEVDPLPVYDRLLDRIEPYDEPSPTYAGEAQP